MNLTLALKQHLQTAFGVAADADDAAYRKAVGEKLATGDLSMEKFMELTRDKAPDASGILQKMLADALNPLTQTVKSLGETVATMKAAQTAPVQTEAPPVQETKTLAATVPQYSPEAIEKMIADTVEKRVASLKVPTADTVIGTGLKASWDDSDSVRVKAFTDRYATNNKKGLFYDARHGDELAGRELKFAGLPVSSPSELENATIGAFLKWQITKSPNNPGFRMNDESWGLLNYALKELSWSGWVGGEDIGTPINNAKLTKTNTSALIGDSDSGGIYVIPTIWEQAIMMTPLLYGQLAPYVNIINLASGTTVRTPFMARPTFTSGTYENTTIDLINTQNFITYMDTSVFPAVAATTIGLDFEQDSLPNFGAAMVKAFGEAAQAYLDDVVANGDGTTEPEGIFTASGTTSVNLANAGIGFTMTDVETFAFGLDKAMRESMGGRNSLIGNDLNYRRLKAMPAWAGTNLRIDDNTYSYMVRGIPYRVVSTTANTKMAMANLGWYYLVRRLGVSMRVETGGDTLVRKNLRLFCCRMRYGGRLRKGSAAAIMPDLPS